MRLSSPTPAPPGHEAVIGTIGMGKSFWILWKIIQSFIFNRPCCYIDPKGDTYYNILNFLSSTRLGQMIWEKYQHRVFFLNPVSESGYRLGFNAIEPMEKFFFANPDRLALLSTSLVSHIKREAGWDIGMAGRMEAILLASLAVLIPSGKYTLNEIPLLYQQTKGADGKTEPFNPFLRSLLENFKHPARMFWDYQWAAWNAHERTEWVNPVENKTFRYLFNENVRQTLCANQTSGLDFRRIVDEPCWLFVNIPYGMLGDTITTLVGNILINKLQYACLQRGPTQDYRLILDEARFFNTGPLDQILDTLRHYRLWLTLVVQSLDQLCRSREGYLDHHLKDVVENETRYYTIFRNVSDADEMAKRMFPLTGQVVRTYYDDRIDYQPTIVEEDMNMRRLMGLVKRQAILWDTQGGRPQLKITPEVEIPEPDYARVAFFESKHLHDTGQPIATIEQEIQEREAGVRALIENRVINIRPQNTGGRQIG